MFSSCMNNGRSINSQEEKVDEDVFICEEANTFHNREPVPVLGVSVHHLDTVFKQLSRDAILLKNMVEQTKNIAKDDKPRKVSKRRFFFSRLNNKKNLSKQTVEDSNNPNDSATIYDIVDPVIKSKGRNVTCPRDGRIGAAYVDCLSGDDHVGKANVMISYGWGNKVDDICAVLVKYCNQNRLDVKRTYVWICCLCNNQFRVDEQDNVPFEDFEKIFEDKVVGINNVLSLMSPWNAPVYLTRVWCIFELHKAHSNLCNLTIAMPPSEEAKMIEAVLTGEDSDQGTGGIHDLYDALSNTNIQDAKASRDEDRQRILQMVEESSGVTELNLQVNQMLREWMRKTLDSFAMAESSKADDATSDLALSRKFIQIGLVYDNQGEYDKALEYYERAHSIRQKVHGNNDPTLATTYNNIGSIYDNQGDYSKALEYYQKARDILRNTQKKDLRALLANIYNNIGLVYDNLEDYEKALENYRAAQSIRIQVLGKDHPSLANILNNIGSVYDKQGEYEEAMKCYKKALVYEEKYYGREHPQVATTYNNIGLVFCNEGNFEKALEYYEKARVIEEKLCGQDHPDIATTYNNIGGAYDSLGDDNMALNYYKMALDIEQKCFGEDHPAVASTCANIGYLCNDIGDYENAICYFQRVHSIEEKAFGECHPELVSALNAIGSAYTNIGNYEQALEYYSKAQSVQEKVSGDDDSNLASILNNIGGVYMRKGNLDLALSFFEKALNLLKNSLGSDHPNTVNVSESIAYLMSVKPHE